MEDSAIYNSVTIDYNNGSTQRGNTSTFVPYTSTSTYVPGATPCAPYVSMGGSMTYIVGDRIIKWSPYIGKGYIKTVYSVNGSSYLQFPPFCAPGTPEYELGATLPAEGTYTTEEIWQRLEASAGCR